MWHPGSHQLLPQRAWKLCVPTTVAALLLTSTITIPDTEPLPALGLTAPKFWRACQPAQNVSFI
ncbi:MAG TPA: hypothetical protein VKY19_16150 [Ktedonosporobacter sp.]|nr:hypothetical protein [Ktedonosporobacter sp.]